MTRIGYQISVDVDAHRRNMSVQLPAEPVMVLAEVLESDRIGWVKRVHQVRCTTRSWSEYGWGDERAHARGTRNDASIWMFTEGPVEYREEGHDGWQTAP